MKKIFYILASAIVALGAVACENDGLDNIATVNGDTVSFIASIDNNRTALDGLDTVWDTDDTIQIEWNETTYNFKNSAEEPNKFSCTEKGLSGIVNANITATYSHNNDGNIDSNAGTAGALLTYTGPFAGIEFAVQNAFLKFTATADAEVILTASAEIFSTGNTLTLTGTGAEQYVAVEPKTTTITYAINGEEVKTSQENALGKGKIYLLGELNVPVIKDGAYFVVANNGTNWYLMNGGDTSTKYRAVTKSTASTTYSDDYTTYTNATADNVWNIEKVDGEDAYTFANNSKTLWLSTVTEATTVNNNAYVSDKAEDAEKLILTKNENGSFEVKSTTNSGRILAFNKTSGQERFAFYMGTQVMDLYLVPVTGKIKSNLTMSFSGDVTINVGEKFVAPTLTFTPNGTYDVKYSVVGSIASVEENEVKVDTSAAGTATVTATFEGNDDYNPATATYTITVKEEQQGGGESVAEGWYLVTSASELAVGDQIVIAATGSNHALGADKGNNRNAATITKSGDKSTITINNDVQIITLEKGKVSGTFAFNVGTAGYLYAASSSSNHLKTKTTLDNNGSWKIEITSAGVATIKAQGDYTRNWIRKNSSSALFACYGSGQSDVCIYKYVSGNEGGETPDEPETPAEPDKLSTPTGLQADAKDNTIEVSWTAVANASGYTVTCGTDSKDVTETTATFTGLEYETKYTITVVAKGDGTNYTNSDAASTDATTEADPNAGGDEPEQPGGGDEPETPTTKYFVKVTSAPSDWSGTYLIVYESSTTNACVFNGLSGTGKYESATISNSTIEATEAMMKNSVEISTMSGGYSVKINSSNINNANKYINGTSDSNKMNFNANAQANTLSYDNTNKCVRITSNTSVLCWNDANNTGKLFRYYKSSSYASQKAIQLYKLQD